MASDPQDPRLASVSAVIPRELKAEIAYLQVMDSMNWSNIVTEALAAWINRAEGGDIRVPTEPAPTQRKGDKDYIDVAAKVPRQYKARASFIVIGTGITWADVLTRALSDWFKDYRARRENDEGQTQGNGSEED